MNKSHDHSTGENIYCNKHGVSEWDGHLEHIKCNHIMHAHDLPEPEVVAKGETKCDGCNEIMDLDDIFPACARCATESGCPSRAEA